MSIGRAFLFLGAWLCWADYIPADGHPGSARPVNIARVYLFLGVRMVSDEKPILENSAIIISGFLGPQWEG